MERTKEALHAPHHMYKPLHTSCQGAVNTPGILKVPLRLCNSGKHVQQQLHEQQHVQECFLTCEIQVCILAAVELEAARLTIRSTWRHPPCNNSTFSPAVKCATVVAECQGIGANLILCREVESGSSDAV